MTEQVKLKLGDRVRFTQPLRRISEFRSGGRVSYEGWGNLIADKSWVPNEWFNLKVPAEGIIVGKRVIYDGEAHYGFEDNPTTFKVTKSITVYEIAYDLRRATVYVSPEHVEFLEGGIPE